MQETARGRHRIGQTRAAILLGLLLLALALLAYRLELRPETVERFIRDLGAWGVLASIALMVLHSFVPFPAELVAFANGMVYGPIWGTVVTWVGAMLGALVAFALARRAGRPLVERFVERRHLERLDRRIAAGSVPVLLLVRLLPVVSFNLVNYGVGLTRVPLWTFLWTTGLGILPPTVVMVVMGDNLEHLTGWTWGAILAVFLALSLLWWWLRGRAPAEDAS